MCAVLSRFGNFPGFEPLALRSRKALCCNHLRFLTQFGTCIALRASMDSERNTDDPVAFGANVSPGSVRLTQDGVRAMRHNLHELANVFTGVMIAGDLLALRLVEGSLRRYAVDICAGSTRGCALVRELRSQLQAACGETEASGGGSTGSGE